MSLQYRVMLEPEEDGGFVVWALALPGCATQGATREEALANIREAIQCYLESCQKHRERIPREDAIEEATVEVSV